MSVLTSSLDRIEQKASNQYQEHHGAECACAVTATLFKAQQTTESFVGERAVCKREAGLNQNCYNKIV